MKQAIFLCVLIIASFISCNKSEINDLSDKEELKKFDNSSFERSKIFINDVLLNDKNIVYYSNKVKGNDNEEKYSLFQNKINELNEYFKDSGVSVSINDFDLLQMENPDNLDLFLSEGYLNKTDIKIIKNFDKYMNENQDFDIAILKLKKDILSDESIKIADFEKFNFLINYLEAYNYYFNALNNNDKNEFNYNTLSINSSRGKGRGWKFWTGCGVALAANAVATYGLTSCVVPGPNCAAAVIGKGLAYAGIYFSCT